MFKVLKIEDNIAISPSEFNVPLELAILQALEQKYSNKIIPNGGLVIKILEILEIGTAFIHPGYGSSYSKVLFHCIIFRPFPGETLAGQICEHHREKGVRINMKFFSDIWIRPTELVGIPKL